MGLGIKVSDTGCSQRTEWEQREGERGIQKKTLGPNCTPGVWRPRIQWGWEGRVQGAGVELWKVKQGPR